MTAQHKNRSRQIDSGNKRTGSFDIEPFLFLVNADSRGLVLQSLVRCASVWLEGRRCALWWIDKNRNGFHREYQESGDQKSLEPNAAFLAYEIAEELGLLSAEAPVVIKSLAPDRLAHLDLTSCLAAPIRYDERTAGFLVAFPVEVSDQWSDNERETLKILSRQGAILCGNYERRTKQTKLLDFVQRMSEANAPYTVNELVLEQRKALLECDRVVVRRVNLRNGHLNYERSEPSVTQPFNLPLGEGVTGKALQDRKTYRIDDVTAPKWKEIYRGLWPNLPPSRSELAVPILLRKQRVLVGTGHDFVDKPFGVLNFESPTKAAFSTFDQYCAEVIAERVARVSERIEFDHKLNRMREAAQALAMKRDWDPIVDTLLSSIRDSLGYEFVSLSIVDLDAQVIRCVRAIGIEESAEFCKAAVHNLDSDHVQAAVVRTKRVEVPAPDDPRLSDIATRFGLNKLIRVFVPMTVLSRNEVIGTITAGYDRTYRQYIYKRDVQLLRTLVAFGTNAMESWQRGNIDRVSHEMNAPLTAVRGNLERLRTKRTMLSDDQIDRALEYMETDTHLLYYQVQQLEYVLGGPVAEVVRQPLNTEPVLIFRDIIFKTMNQLRPLVRDFGFDPKKISFSEEDVHKIKRLSVDKSKISQVIFNLFMNALKYAEDAESFRIHIGVDVKRGNYIIKFCDWGIGIPSGLEEKIFRDRFRAPVAQEKVIKGSGLGLTIARQLMREHGGDLILAHNRKPTEFHLIFPRQLRKRNANNVY